jgi:hypothetical protein
MPGPKAANPTEQEAYRLKPAEESAEVFKVAARERKNAKARARRALAKSTFKNEQPDEMVGDTVQDIETDKVADDIENFFNDNSPASPNQVVDFLNTVRDLKTAAEPKSAEPPVKYDPKPEDSQEEASLNQAKLTQYAKDLKAAYVAGDLEIPQYMIAVDLLARKDIASIEQLLNVLNGMKPSENDPLLARSSSFKAQGKADLERLIKMLGSQMYQGNLAEITIKEVVQNSFDAVKASLNAKGEKGITNGQIDIITDPGARIIAIRDNGQGMSKEVLLNAFLTVAGTDKSGMATGDASGGFGMAKAAFLYGNEWIEVNTVKGGKSYKFKGTGNDIISKGIDVITETAPKNEHGTVIVIKVPEHVEVNGKQQYVWFPNDLNEISFFKQPLLHDSIEINLQQDFFSAEALNNISDAKNEIWNKENFNPIKVGKHSDLSAYSDPVKISFDWGHAELYLGKDRVSNAYTAEHNILSAGVFQFKYPFEIKSYEKIP